MVFANAFHQILDQVDWNWPWFIRLTVVLSQHWLCCLCLQSKSNNNQTQNIKQTCICLMQFSFNEIAIVQPLLSDNVGFEGTDDEWHECRYHGECCWRFHNLYPLLLALLSNNSIPAKNQIHFLSYAKICKPFPKWENELIFRITLPRYQGSLCSSSPWWCK